MPEFTPAKAGPQPDHTPDDAAPPVAPLTPQERARLVQLRSYPRSDLTLAEVAERDALMARENAPPDGSVVPVVKHDPELVAPLTIDLLAELVGIVRTLAESAPGHAIIGRVAALGKSLEELVYHSSPPPVAPPAVTDPHLQEIKDRIAELEAMRRLTIAEDNELVRLKTSIGMV